MDLSPPGFPVPGILQARIPEWAATSYPGDLTNPGTTRESLASPALAGGLFSTSTAWEALENEHLEDGMNAKKESRKSPLGLGTIFFKQEDLKP